MSVQEFKPDSELGQRLKQQIAAKLASLNTEDPAYVAEFLLVLISNNRTRVEIVEEFTSLFGNIIDERFVQDVMDEINNNLNGNQMQQSQQLQHSEQQQLQQQQQEQQQQQQQQAAPVQSFQPAQSAFMPQQGQQTPAQAQKISFAPQTGTAQSAFAGQQFNIPSFPKSMESGDNMMIDGAGNRETRFSENLQRNFRDQADNSSSRFNFTKNNRGSSFKNTRGGRNLNNRRQQDLHKMIEKSLDNNVDQTTTFVSKVPTERCKDFPHCSNRLCQFGHPTKVCRNFPNCPNQNQTCPFLHPGEDDALFKEFERVREAKQQQRNQSRSNTGIILCKFGAICSKELCPFGHPTPANKDAKVTILQWCVDNKECKDPTCPRAHSSPNYSAQSQFNVGGSQAAPGSVPNIEKTLEQCKFGQYCKNIRCPKRHATSSVLCRNGAQCTRIDCTFNHPLNEVCKYGVNCTNLNCAYQHPEGRQISATGATPTGNKVWINGQTQNTGTTSQRQFAVPENHVFEQAPPQQS